MVKHGTLAKAGKVRKQTPKVGKKDKLRKPRGRALKRQLYKKKFEAILSGQKQKSPNWNAGRPLPSKK